MVKRKFLFLLVSLIFCQQINATVETEVTPKETSGSPVTLRFTLRNEEDYEITKAPDEGSDWRIQGPQQVTNSQFTYSNGEANQQTTVTVTYLLQPKKVGNLKIPLAQIKVGSKVYSSPQSTVRVTGLNGRGGGTNPKIARPKIPGFPLFPLDVPDENTPNNAPPINLSKENRKLEVAVVAEPSKTEVYDGELILLPFYIYTNENIFRNLEFASFPTFKDFIKEELYLPKNWRTERVMYRGMPYYKAEIIRFALFPIKSGELLIDPLKMRFEVDTDIFNLLEQMMGEDDNQDPKKNARTFMRSSGSVPIVVKALPPKPESIHQSAVAVGKYDLKIQPPKNDLVQNEAFSLKVKIEGRGNIKGIPEPEFVFPTGLQKSKTETDYSTNTVSEGFKEFDMLLVPRNSGTLVIPENTWAYFDPDKKAYETIKVPSIELKIAPSNKKNPLADRANKLAEDHIFAGVQDFSDGSAPVPPWAWAIPALMYAAAGFFFIQRKRHENEESLIASMPWLLVERKIMAQHDFSTNEALGLVEEWILCRFRVLNIQEAAFDDLSEALRRKTPASIASKIDNLRERFKQIEFARFSGKKKNSLNLSFAEIKKLSEEIIEASLAAAKNPYAATNEEDDE
jgi:hypothetical protein